MKKKNFIFIACALILAVFTVFSMAAKPVKQVKPAYGMTFIQNPKQDCADENCEKEECEDCKKGGAKENNNENQKPKKEKRRLFGKKLKTKDYEKNNEKQQENRKEAR